MIRAILKNGKIQPLDELPGDWRDGQELTIEGGAPSDDPREIQKWYDELQRLAEEVPESDHEIMAAAIRQQDELAKAQMRKKMGLE
jgi:hypothetical protein